MKQAILDALPYRPATLTSKTVFGKKYEVLVLITGANGRTAGGQLMAESVRRVAVRR